MSLKFTSLQEFYAHGFATVIDVRSPAEHAEDHVPGAISLPVLNNDERAEVGTIYVQDSPFNARKLGAALVFRNAANHIEQSLSHHEGSWKPLVYCWRGGQRSGSFTWMLQQIGWRAEVVEGGYQSYRRLVHKAMYETALPLRLVALDGYTGSAKTEVLKRAGALGVQVLDLEGLANHRGSLLGEMPTPQPSQKGFESAVAGALMQLDPARPVLVEAESNKIGQRIIPPAVWEAMKQAPRIELQVPVAARCRYLVQAYDDILSDAARLRDKLGPLRAHRSGAIVDGWFSSIEAGDKAGLTAALMAEHYDPAYRKSRAAIGAKVAAAVEAVALDEAGLDAAATQVAAVMSSL
ncbi:tRNA 2-selenouridine(34) synthase MnmH [Rhodobacteraceae bacterium (ex Bugula neritina AB1)]|nr:tRNA 2-selenouridine(34) synthase MnmH [Rhodobacteraceae bacterium (ex Bugula neritina AB1)]